MPKFVADSSVSPTGLKWAAAAGSQLNTSFITSGSITSGTSLTLSSLSDYDQLFLWISNLNSSANGSAFRIRLNGSSSAVYATGSVETRLGGTNAGTGNVGTGDTSWSVGQNYGFKNNTQNGVLIRLTNCKSASGFTNAQINAVFEHFNTTDRIIFTSDNVFASNETISSIVLSWLDGNTFSAGNYRLYGAK